MMPFPFSLLSPFNQIFEKFVNQPVTDWHNFYSPNFVFQYNPEDQPVEQHVLRKVGSYGRQLGLVIGMIQLIRSQLPIASSALSESERELVKDFDALVKTQPHILHALPFIQHAERKRTRGLKWIAEG